MSAVTPYLIWKKWKSEKTPEWFWHLKEVTKRFSNDEICCFHFLSVCMCICVCLWVFQPSGTVVKESACQCRRHKRRRFNPWVGKIRWSRKWLPTPWLPTPVFLLGESHRREEPGRLQSMGSQRVKPDWTWLWMLHEFTVYLTCIQNVVISEPQGRGAQ